MTTTPPRYERKYRLPATEVYLIQQLIRLHPAGFRQVYPPRWINNIYYDTPDLQAYQDNLAGITRRRKIRLRWYGTLEQFGCCPVLEVKEKENALGWKRQQRLTPGDWLDVRQQVVDLMGLAAFRDIDISSQYVSHERKNPRQKTFIYVDPLGLEPLAPRLLNRYLRHYYQTADDRFRITVDEQQQFWRYTDVIGLGPPHVTDPQLILELKYLPENETDARTIAQHLPFRMTKHSKYVQGIASVYQTVGL